MIDLMKFKSLISKYDFEEGDVSVDYTHPDESSVIIRGHVTIDGQFRFVDYNNEPEFSGAAVFHPHIIEVFRPDGTLDDSCNYHRFCREINIILNT